METEAVVPGPGALREARPPRDEALAVRSVSRTLVFSASSVYASVFSAAAVVHVLVFRSPRSDLGNMVQAVWSTSHGRFLEMTALSGAEVTRLGIHVEPFLALLVPLWWIWSSPMMLVVLEAVVVSCGAVPVYWLARKHLRSDRAALHLALAFLVYPATQFNAFEEASGFHAVSLSITFILFAIWFLDENRLVPFAVFALLACSTREQIPAAVGCLGIWYAFRHRRPLVGASIFCLGVSASLVNFLVIIPHYSRSGVDPFAGRYTAVGGTPAGIFHKAVSDPAALFTAAATPHKLAWLALLLLPFLGFWLREPLLMLGVLPQLAIDILSSRPEMTSVAYHYTAGIVPFVVASSVFGLARLRDPGRLSLAVLVAVACTVVYNPLSMVGTDVRALSSSARAATAQAVRLIPSDAPVSSSNRLGMAFASRRYAFTFPAVGSATWIVIDKADPTYRNRADYLYAIHAVESSSTWRTVYTAHGITVLHRATSR